MTYADIVTNRQLRKMKKGQKFALWNDGKFSIFELVEVRKPNNSSKIKYKCWDEEPK